MIVCVPDSVCMSEYGSACVSVAVYSMVAEERILQGKQSAL